MPAIPKDASLYLRVLENMEEAVIAIDCSGKIVLYNPAAQICTGLSEKQALGKTYQSLFKKQEKLLYLVATALEQNRSLFSNEDIMLERPNGDPLPVRVALSPNFDQNGNPDGVILMLRDLTQVRELQDAIQRAEKLSMLGTLAAGLAHEIKNPWAASKGRRNSSIWSCPSRAPSRNTPRS
ncbi:MAG: PAS domain S-box protein [Syntrophotaleaceae bacterium]